MGKVKEEYLNNLDHYYDDKIIKKVLGITEKCGIMNRVDIDNNSPRRERGDK